MLIKLNKQDKKGNEIYLNKLTGESGRLPHAGGRNAKKMPDYSFAILYGNRRNPEFAVMMR